MNSPHLWGARKRNTRWPDPEKSIGQLYGEKQGKLCWQAQGPAREAFCLVAPIIKQHLNNCSNVVPGTNWITWSIYMIGKSESTAIPTIMFESFQKAPRKEAMEMVRKSGILNEYPGIETGHWSFPPNIIFPQQLTLTASEDALTPAEDCARGPQVTVRNFSNGSFEYRKATIGALIREQGSNYYFTVSHAFSPENTIVPWPTDHFDFDDDCEFGGQSDAEDDEEEEAFVEATSRGSRSPESLSDDDSGDGIAIEGHLGDPELGNRKNFSETSRKNMNDSTFQPEKSGEFVRTSGIENSSDSDYKERKFLEETEEGSAALTTQDMYIMSSELDYALMLSAENDTTMSFSDDIPVPFSRNGIPFILPKNVADEIPETASIITMTGSSGWVTGEISGPPSYTRLPNTGAYQEVFTVNLNGPLYHGDCGSCIFDSKTGCLYGHIIAGSTVTRTAYLIPAASVFKDVASRIESLPLATSTKQYSSYRFDFSQLHKILSNSGSPPPSPTGFSEASTLINNTTRYDLKDKLATDYTVKMNHNRSTKLSTSPPEPFSDSTNSHLKRDSYRPNQLRSPGKFRTPSKDDSGIKDISYSLPRNSSDRRSSIYTPSMYVPRIPRPPGNSSDRRPTITTGPRYPEVVIEVGRKARETRPDTFATRLPDPTSQVGEIERDDRKTVPSKKSGANTADENPLSLRIRPAMSRSVGFILNPVLTTSRPLNYMESWAAYDFERHAQKCVYCRDPYEVHRRHSNLCEIGHSEAQRVASLMYYQTDGNIYSTTEEQGIVSRLELPQFYTQVKSLLRAIERSLRHRGRAPFVSMDSQNHVATGNRPTVSKAGKELKIAESSFRARLSVVSQKSVDPAADMPPSQPSLSWPSEYHSYTERR